MKPDQEFVETAQQFFRGSSEPVRKIPDGLAALSRYCNSFGAFLYRIDSLDGFGNTGKGSHQMMLLLTFLTLALGLLLFIREWSMAGCTGPSRDRPGYCTITAPGGTRG